MITSRRIDNKIHRREIYSTARTNYAKFYFERAKRLKNNQEELRADENYPHLKQSFEWFCVSPEADPNDFKEYSSIMLPVLNWEGEADLAISLLEKAVQKKADSLDFLEAFNWLSWFYELISKYAEAREIALKAFEISRQIGDYKSQTTALNRLAKIHRTKGEYHQALDYYQQSITISTEKNDAPALANVHISEGLVYWHLSEYEKALECYNQSMNFFRNSNDIKECHALNNIGLIYTELGCYPEALDCISAALKISEQVGDQREIGINNGNLGLVYYHLDDYDAACDHVLRSLTFTGKLGNNYRTAKQKVNLSLIYRDLGGEGKLAASLQCAKEAAEIGFKFDIVHFQIIGLSYAALPELALGNSNIAFEKSTQAVHLMEQQRVFDGLEEEIYFNHYLILDKLKLENSLAYLRKSHDIIMEKVARIANSAFKESYLKNVKLHRRIIVEFRKLNKV